MGTEILFQTERNGVLVALTKTSDGFYVEISTRFMKATQMYKDQWRAMEAYYDAERHYVED